MKRFNSTLSGLVIVGCTVLIYAALVVLSAGCALAHADRTQAHHHHSEKSSSPQNAFCAWACQATADTVAEAGPPLAVKDLVSGPVEFASTGLLLSIDTSAIHSRAPPSIS